MELMKLNLDENLHENIIYEDHLMPLSLCVDHFDMYYKREWTSHWHEEIELSVLVQGKLLYKMTDSDNQKVTRILNTGDGILINSGILHSAKALEPETVLSCIVIPLPLFEIEPFNTIKSEYILPLIKSNLTDIFLDKNADNAVILKSIVELCEMKESETGYELHSFELVCQIWRVLSTMIEKQLAELNLGTGENIQSKRVKQMIQFIHENFKKSITVEDMAKAVGISRSECFRCFKTVLNKTPLDYLNDYRMSLATMLLADESRTITEISDACGFQSPSYFGKKFNLQFKMSPSKYRKQAMMKISIN